MTPSRSDLVTELVKLANKPVTVLRNPRVAALIVDENNKIVATGIHEGKGKPHAEVSALNKIQNSAKGLTMFVSLEPCNHFGTTPPCTNAIISSGISKVIIGSIDINPLAGGGIAKLKSAGIKVEVISDQEIFRNLNYRWFESIKLKRPFVSAKIAMTLDGFISTNNKERLQISDPSSDLETAKLRSQFDAIIVGTNTIEVDNPYLTVRNQTLDFDNSPLRVIMGNRELDKNSNVFNSAAKTVQIRTHDPNILLEELQQMGINTVLLEGGSSVLSSFLKLNLIDEFTIYLSSKILGKGLQVFDSIVSTSSIKSSYFESAVPLGADLKLHVLSPRGV